MRKEEGGGGGEKERCDGLLEREREREGVSNVAKKTWVCGVRTFSFLFFLLLFLPYFLLETGEKERGGSERTGNLRVCEFSFLFIHFYLRGGGSRLRLKRRGEKREKKEEKNSLFTASPFFVSPCEGVSLLCSLFFRERVQFSPVASACTWVQTEKESDSGRNGKKSISSSSDDLDVPLFY